MSDKIFSQFVRRSEKYITDSTVRPIAGQEGTNHITSPSLWTGNEIYKGEIFINTTDGKLYTSDGIEILTLNAPNGILSGLELGVPVNAGFPSNAIPLDFALSTGIAIIDGRTYYYKSNLDQGITDSDSQISPNTHASLPRMDFIFVVGSTDAAIDQANEFSLDIVIVEGINYNNNPVFGETLTDAIVNGTYGLNLGTPVPENGLFVGMIWVPPNYLAIPPDHENLIRPLPVSKTAESSFIFETSAATLISQIQLSLSVYKADLTLEPNTFYLQGQHVSVSNGVQSDLWVCKETGYANIFGDVQNYATFEPVGGGGGGSPLLGLNDLTDVVLEDAPLPAQGDFLMYVEDYQGSGLGKWINTSTMPGGGDGGDAINISFTTCNPPGIIGTEIDNVQDAICALNSILSLLVPAPPPLLSAIIPEIIGTFQSGILPSGLNAVWYLESAIGDTIIFTKENDYSIEYNGYSAGTASDAASAGTIQGLQIYNGITTEIGNKSAPAGTIGQVTLDSLSVFDTFYQIADAHILRSPTSEGWMEHQLQRSPLSDGNYTEDSTIKGTHYDDSSTTVVFTGALTIGENTVNYKWLSGISYYGLNTSMNYNYTVTNAFQKVYHPISVGKITHPAISYLINNPASIPVYTDTFMVNDILTFDVSDVYTTANVVATILKPFNSNEAQSQETLLKDVSTYGILSTATIEFFHDEDKRLNENGTAFDSTAVLLSTQSLVIPGVLNKSSGSPTMFERKFTIGPAKKSGTFILEGITITDINPVATPGKLNFLIQHPVNNLWYDCKKDFGTGGAGTLVDPIGAYVGTSSGVNLQFSFGTTSTGVLTEIKLRIVHHISDTITKITLTS